MLISALCDYYTVLSENHKLKEAGYADCDISYFILLTSDGRLAGFRDNRIERTIKDKKGKEKIILVPQAVSLPERPRSTTISANFVEVRPGYIFGLGYQTDKSTGREYLSTETEGRTDKQKERLKLQHQSFCEEVLRDFGSMSSPLAKAYVQFARKWNPEAETENQVLLGIKSDLNKVKFAFCLEGHPELLLQDDEEVKEKWRELSRKTDEEPEKKAYICQCSVTGEKLPVAEVHDSMVSGSGVGIRNAGINPSLVNFKPESFLSYNHRQGENACISAKAMKQYTRALNFLLKSPSNHCYMDGQTMIYWSVDGNPANDFFMGCIFEEQSEQYEEGELESALSQLMKDALNGTATSYKFKDIEQRITTGSEYYIVGLAPNASRIQVKFICRQKFGKLLHNIARFQSEMQIQEAGKPVAFWRVKKELVSPASTHPEDDDTPFDSVLQAIFNGTDYPSWCLKRMVTRVRKDSDKENNKFIRLNRVRAGFIKACLIRHTKEEISMSYDSGSRNPAYVSGAIFAILQMIQEEASSPVKTTEKETDKYAKTEEGAEGRPAKLNRTIKDAYFSMAVSNPAAVMPRLIKLSNFHLKKLRRDHPEYVKRYESALADAMEKLDGAFPRTLDLYDQGRFILGYYQRYNAFFKKKEK